jgi:hypothetical protein
MSVDQTPRPAGKIGSGYEARRTFDCRCQRDLGHAPPPFGTRRIGLTVVAAVLYNRCVHQMMPPGMQGGPFSQSKFSYMLTATAESLKYSIENVPDWLTASPKSGTATTSGTTVTFEIDRSIADKLTPNTYSGSINFINTSSGQGNRLRDAFLTVVPAEYTVEVRASPSADGVVSGGGTFFGGSLQTVTATPNTGRTFFHWTENGRVVSTDEIYSFTLDGNVTLVADFK